jgi:hypothetical protein
LHHRFPETDPTRHRSLTGSPSDSVRSPTQRG